MSFRPAAYTSRDQLALFQKTTRYTQMYVLSLVLHLLWRDKMAGVFAVSYLVLMNNFWASSSDDGAEGSFAIVIFQELYLISLKCFS